MYTHILTRTHTHMDTLASLNTHTYMHADRYTHVHAHVDTHTLTVQLAEWTSHELEMKTERTRVMN